MWLLGTNVWVRYLNPGDTPVKSRIHQHAPAGKPAITEESF